LIINVNQDIVASGFVFLYSVVNVIVLTYWQGYTMASLIYYS